jgi:FtsH-binding integral membrane protein
MIDYRNEFITNKASDKNFNEGLRLYMLKIYNYMAIGLLITGIMAFATLNFEPLVQLMYKLTPTREVYGITGFGIIIQLVPLIIAFSFGFGFANISVANARILFWLYAITMGMSFLPKSQRPPQPRPQVLYSLPSAQPHSVGEV